MRAKRKLINWILVVVTGVVYQLSWAASDGPLFPSDGHCVAYKTIKTMFLIFSDPVIGKNCEVSAQVLPELGGLYRIEVNIPIKNFSTDNETRDKDVANTLLVDVRPEMLYKTKPLTVEQWQALFKKGKFEVEGELTIGDKAHPLKMESEYSEKDGAARVNGITRVKFDDFSLKPPKFALGLVGKTKADIELHFQLQSGRILGADTIRPKEKE